jgi:tRNA(fMet)-specific endonuclease VapC
MRYLIDTHWVASYLNGRKEAVELFTSLEGQELAIAQPTYGEVYEGIYYGRDRRAKERGFREFLRAVDVVPLTQAIWRRFAMLRGDLRAKGQLIADLDLLIAATALHDDRLLVTRNLRHFTRVPELQLHTPETT